MKVFLASLEGVDFIKTCITAKHYYGLFSYYHWNDFSNKLKDQHRDLLNSHFKEIICDSGLFTLMFGAGKGGSYDLDFMRTYTDKYIATAQRMGINNLTIVEADVHKILGMPAVFELRKRFEASGLPVLYVWHKEEGIDGLMKMAEKYPYIALSVPELRVVFKGTKHRYQDVVHKLLSDLRKHCGTKLPKIHLLGNTVQETMETTIAYSCDSTSWVSGGRFGTSISFQSNKLTPIRTKSDYFQRWLKDVFPKYRSEFLQLTSEHPAESSGHFYRATNLFSAMQMRLFQDYLDKYYQWIGIENAKRQ